MNYVKLAIIGTLVSYSLPLFANESNSALYQPTQMSYVNQAELDKRACFVQVQDALQSSSYEQVMEEFELFVIACLEKKGYTVSVQ